MMRLLLQANKNKKSPIMLECLGLSCLRLWFVETCINDKGSEKSQRLRSTKQPKDSQSKPRIRDSTGFRAQHRTPSQPSMLNAPCNNSMPTSECPNAALSKITRWALSGNGIRQACGSNILPLQCTPPGIIFPKSGWLTVNRDYVWPGFGITWAEIGRNSVRTHVPSATTPEDKGFCPTELSGPTSSLPPPWSKASD